MLGFGILYIIVNVWQIVYKCVYYIYTLIYRGDDLNIIINNSSSVSLYEQITNQIRNQIIDGTLKPEEMLPSIRKLAKELKVSIITTKRAYEELEREGYIHTVVGKGTFVLSINSERLKESAMMKMEEDLEKVIVTAKSLGLSLEECIEILSDIYREV